MDPITGTAIAAGASAIGSWLSTESSNKANLKLWREQANYNKPINQVKRLKEASLNPALMYGAGSGANTVGAAPVMSAPNYGDVGDKFSKYFAIRNESAQLGVIEGQVKKLNADVLETAARIDNINADTAAKVRENRIHGDKGLGETSSGSFLGNALAQIGSIGDKVGNYVADFVLGKYKK